jgi:hypothetical protein
VELMTGLGMLAAMASGLLLIAGCTNPETSPSPRPVTPTATAAGSMDELCDPEADISLSAVAADLEEMDEATDADALADRLRRTAAALETLHLGPDGMSVRDAAVGILRDVEADLAIGSTESESAPIAAQVLREMEVDVCPPPES